MFPTYIVQWWHGGAWREMGWRASTPKSLTELEKHGQKLADYDPDERYRLATLSPWRGREPESVRDFVARQRVLTGPGRTVDFRRPAGDGNPELWR